jgi:hypothetical protein
MCARVQHACCACCWVMLTFRLSADTPTAVVTTSSRRRDRALTDSKTQPLSRTSGTSTPPAAAMLPLSRHSGALWARDHAPALCGTCRHRSHTHAHSSEHSRAARPAFPSQWQCNVAGEIALVRARVVCVVLLRRSQSVHDKHAAHVDAEHATRTQFADVLQRHCRCVAFTCRCL